MKKILLASICATAMAGVSFGQGYINWGTITPTYFTAQTNSTQYSSLSQALGGGLATGKGAVGGVASGVSGGATYYYALLYANGTVASPASTASLASWNSVTTGGAALMGTNSSSATVGRVTSEGVAGESINLANGTTYSVLFVGWSANLGSTWSTVENELVNWSTAQFTITGDAFFGTSTVGAYNPGAAAPGNTPFGTVASGLINSPNTQLYLLQAVPEPTTMALAALGGAAMLFIRRKK